MKLIRQTALWNNDGNADKIYEIDLCETAPGRYVVNFRYGRRGAALKDGTKTAMPVSLPQAEDIFAKLAAEKRKGGYRDTENYVAETEATTAPVVPQATPQPDTNEHQAYVLRCMREATQPQPGKIVETWPLHRIIWRAGELRIRDAAPLIIPQLTKGNALMQYTACWSLGRCGNPAVIAPLEQVYESKATAPHVKRIALAALLQLKKETSSDAALVQTMVNGLPAEVQQCLENEDADNLKIYLDGAATSAETLPNITTVYLLAEHFAAANSAIYEWLKTTKLRPNTFKVARHIFKLAEFRDDAPIFSLLAYKFETTGGLFKYQYWDRNSYAYYGDKSFKKAIDEQKKDHSGLAYSETTRQYFMRRVWRTMRTLGQDGDEAYIRFAFGVLLQYNKGIEGKKEHTRVEKIIYRYNTATRKYETVASSKLYSAYAESLLLNYILYSNGKRHFLGRNTKAWQLQTDVAAAAIIKREDAFPELWDKYPQALVQLLFDSEQEIVHQFAVKALKDRTDLADYFDLAALKKLLQKPFAATAQLALRLAEKMYDANHPDEELVIALLLHAVEAARKLALQWIGNQPDYFFRQTDIPVHLFVNPYAEVFEITDKWLRERLPVGQQATVLVGKVIEHLLGLPAEMPLAETAAEHAAKLLSSHLLQYLGDTTLETVRQLLGRPVASVQLLGAIILLHHPTPPEKYPEGLLSGMIQSAHPQVRQAGITLFGRLPEQQLFDNAGLVAAFCVSPYAEIRTAIQPTVSTLNQKNKAFGLSLLTDLLPYMHRKETSDDLHANLYQLFTGPLAEHLVTIDPVTALAFLHSRFPVPQLLGLFILKNYNQVAGLTMRQWVRMANHEVLEIRQFCWQLFTENVGRIQTEASEALRILDSTWDDSRQFAFGYFRQHFTETTWTPELLVSVCDSTRADVQQFGREMITKYFKEENGELYLLQLSQHPAQQVQHFTTHYLEQFAAGKPLNIEKLEAYFITVLSQVNRAGTAKKRVFQFLRQEALKSREVATIAARILARQSATMAIADKAACIGIMNDLRKQYEGLDMPLEVLGVEAYEGR